VRTTTSAPQLYVAEVTVSQTVMLVGPTTVVEGEEGKDLPNGMECG
jgi:hypothetical protein